MNLRSVCLFNAFLFACAAVSPVAAQAAGEAVIQSGQYAPGARSSASANSVLDSVIGETPRKIKTTIQSGGHYYYVTSNGEVLDTHGNTLPGNLTHASASTTYHKVDDRSDTDEDNALEPIFIGVLNRDLARKAHLHFPGKPNAEQPLMRSSIGPDGVFIAPCRDAGGNMKGEDRIHRAALSLARNSGNIYELAGNRNHLVSATHAVPLPGNSAILLSGAGETTP